MALLTGGQRLGLTTTHHDNDWKQLGNVLGSQKSVVFVKLTDSAYGAIANFVKRQKRTDVSFSSPTTKPTIQFSELDGTICIPTGDGVEQAYSFSVSSTDDANGPQGSFECLECCSKGSVDAMGPLNSKLTIHACADAYQRFGERFNEVKREIGKRKTVLLDRSGGKDVGRQKLARKPHADAAVQSVSMASTFPNKPASLASASKNENRHDCRSSMGSKLSANSVVLDHNPSSKPPGGSKPALTEIMKRPLRERIAHLLAVRPYKKPELFLRIKKDGIMEKDKNNITNIVRQVAHTKDNTYRLARHMWNDVSEDWPFYTDEERQMFKRSKPQNLTPPGSDGSSSSVVSGLSSSSSRPASPQTVVSGPSLKKGYPHQRELSQHVENSSYYDSDGIPSCKRKRFSNYVRPKEMQYGSDCEGRSPSTLSGRSPGAFRGESGKSQGHKSPFGDDHNGSERRAGSWLLSENSLRATPPSSSRRSISALEAVAAFPAAADRTVNSRSSSPGCMQSPRSASGSGVNVSVTNYDNDVETSEASSYCGKGLPNLDSDFGMMTQSSASFKENLRKTYRRIVNKEQRKRYKEEFNKDYAEYRRLHEKLNGVSLRFTELKDQLNRRQEGSSSWKEIEAKILMEYRRMMNDPEYVNVRRNFQQLHEKLAHVKKLVAEYDDLNYRRMVSKSRFVDRADRVVASQK